MRIYVTADDIANGKVNNCEGCPIALALRRCTGSKHVDVDAGRLCIDDGGRATPPKVADIFIGDFDEGKPVTPFEFDVEFDYPDEEPDYY